MAFCSGCGAQIADGSTMCAACSSKAVAGSGTQVGGLAENVAGALAYCTIIPAIIFLVLDPFNKNRFVRFHAFQSLFFIIGWSVLWWALTFLSIMALLVMPVIGLGGFIIWIVLVLKAYQGQKFKLPIIGDIAEKQANA